jgi:hypothetical protein
MNRLGKLFASLGLLFASLGLLSLFSVMPLEAQIGSGSGITFTTSFPFNVNGTNIPAGTYTITQLYNINGVLLIRGNDGRYWAGFSVVPTQSSSQSRDDAEVIFKKYGDTLYFYRALEADGSGGMYGDEVIPSKKKTQEFASVAEEERTVVASRN